MPREAGPPGRFGTWLGRWWPLLAAGFLVVALAFVFSKTMQRYLDHDEHQFVASAVLQAREGLVPYRDFPHFHVPYLVYAYGALFEAFDHLLLAARSLAVACAWLTLALVLFTARVALRPLGPTLGPLLALGLGVALLFNPLFVYTTGFSWNHDSSVLLSLAAFLVHARASAPGTLRTVALATSGVLLGLSAGLRLTTLPLAAPFLLSLWLRGGGPEGRTGSLKASVRFLAGLGLGLAPAGVLFAMAPGRAFFGNFQYAGLNTAYRAATDFDVAMTWPEKGRFLLDEILLDPANAALIGLLVAAWLLRPRGAPRGPAPAGFVLLCLPFILLGSLAPTPTWPQYFYAVVPVLFVGLASALGSYGQAPARRAALCVGVVVAAALAVVGNLSSYRTLSNLVAPDEWIPSRIHAVGLAIDAAAPPGPILTVSPIFPLEGGRPIYRELTSGPFALRTASLMSAEERREQGVVSADELDLLVGTGGPAAVFVGHDRQTDPLLEDWARARGMQPLRLEGGERLYLPAPQDG